MAAIRKPLAHFKTHNGKGFVITPYFSTVDLVEMRKHPDYTECDAEGNEVESPKAEPAPAAIRREAAPVATPKKSKKADVTA